MAVVTAVEGARCRRRRSRLRPRPPGPAQGARAGRVHGRDPRTGPGKFKKKEVTGETATASLRKTRVGRESTRPIQWPSTRLELPALAGIGWAWLFAALRSPLTSSPTVPVAIAYARSLIWMPIVDFANDYAGLGMMRSREGIEFGAVTRTGEPGNAFGMGFHAAVVTFMSSLPALRGSSRQRVLGGSNGLGTITLWAVHFGTWSYAARVPCTRLVDV